MQKKKFWISTFCCEKGVEDYFFFKENGFGLCILELFIVAELTHKLTQDWNFVIQLNKIASPLYVPVHIFVLVLVCTCMYLYVSTEMVIPHDQYHGC